MRAWSERDAKVRPPRMRGPTSRHATNIASTTRVIAFASLLLTLALAACSPPPAPKTAVPSRIAIRTVAGVAEFYDVDTGATFVPRGHNLVKYTFKDDPVFGPGYADMVLSPARYDRAEIRADFQAMRALGFNVVRVMLETCGASDCIYPLGATTRTLSGAYLDDIADMLALAAEEEMYVWITSNTLPDTGYYLEKGYSGAAGPISAISAHFMTQAGLDAYAEYFSDLFTGLVARDARLDRMFSFSIRNEYWYDLREEPWTLSSGVVTTASGASYDLAVPAERDALAEETLIHFIDTMVAVVKDKAPTALVSVGFFAPNTPHAWRPGDFKYILTERALAESDADFFDLHSHPAPMGLSIDQTQENYGAAGIETKPLVMGELAGFRELYPAIHVAAQELVNWQTASCVRGYDGWLTWHWDGDEIEGPGLWGSNGTVLGEALAPTLHPDPCASATVPNPNLAFGKGVTASNELPGEPAENAVDGGWPQWGSGFDAPQWIEIDLGAEHHLGSVRLTVAQYPDGPTIHEVYGGATSPPATLLHTFSGNTAESDILVHEFAAPPAVRYLRILTTASPSWVSWREIEAFGPGDAP